MTVRRGPFKSVYAGHAALHSIGTGLILTLSHSLPVSIFYSQAHYLCILALSGSQMSILSLSGSLPVYSYTIRLIFSHYQAYCMCTLTRRLAAYLFSLSLRLAACLFSLSLRLAACLFSHYQAYCLSILTLSGSRPVYSHTIRLTACLFSHYQAYCLSILTLSACLFSHYLPVYSHTIRLTACLFSHSGYCLSVFTPNAVKAFLLCSSPMYSCTLGLTAYLILH